MCVDVLEFVEYFGVDCDFGGDGFIFDGGPCASADEIAGCV